MCAAREGVVPAVVAVAVLFRAPIRFACLPMSAG